MLNTQLIRQRLLNEYAKHGQLIVAVDFDDTIFDFHRRGVDYSDVVELVKRCQSLGCYVVIFTASDPERYYFIRQYCSEAGIFVSSINKNPIDLPYGNNGKIFYNILLDDRAGLKSAYEDLLFVIEEIEACLKFSQ